MSHRALDIRNVNRFDINAIYHAFHTKFYRTKVKKKYGSPQQSRPKTLDVGTVEHPISSPPMRNLLNISKRNIITVIMQSILWIWTSLT